MKIYIPGNLLLLGEYAITLQGNKGIGFAVDTWASIQAEPSDRLIIISNFQGKQMSWTENSIPTGPMALAACILSSVRKYTSNKKKLFSSLKITIDTSNFYYSDGRKKGFGSSAAVSAGLTYLLLHYAYEKSPDIKKEVFPLALSIHREFQGGKGSGYDIAASLFGGAGVFTGGIIPSWQPIKKAWFEYLHLIRGDEEASTKEFLSLFHQFGINNPAQFKQFLHQSNAIVEKITLCDETQAALELFFEASKLNQWIHQKLGISSEGAMLKAQLNCFREYHFPGKSLGAGGEIAAVLIPQNNLLHNTDVNLEPLKITNSGLRCEQ